MADNWIKMRTRLADDPHVVSILSALRADGPAETCQQVVTDTLRVVGALHTVWSIFDEQSCDGRLRGYTPEVMDRRIGWPGFSRAMIDVGWLGYDGEVLEMHNFTVHNGQSAKRRAMNALYQQTHRESVSSSSASDADKMLTRGEERRVEEKREVKSKSVCASAHVRAHFTPPTLDEVKAYCQERGGKVDPQAWWDHYAANGWRVGRSPMKDWKAAVRTWEHNGLNSTNGNGGRRPSGALVPTGDEIEQLRENVRRREIVCRVE